MKKLIDIHSHILHCLDDGPSDLDASVEMCRIAIEDGVSDIIATPHAFHPQFPVSVDNQKKRIVELQNELKKLGLQISIHSGFECRIHEKLITNIIEHPEFTLCEKGKFFLVEFDPMFIPPDFETFLFEAQINGLQPILVHPERNSEIIKNIKRLQNFVEKGLEVQITASSITGKRGRKIQHAAKEMIKKDIVHYVASDIHSPNRDNYNLKSAYDTIVKLSSEKYADALFTTNSNMILEG